MGIDNDKEEDNEENVGDIAHNLPNLVDWRRIFEGDWLDNEELFDLGIDSVNGFAEGAGSWTN